MTDEKITNEMREKAAEAVFNSSVKITNMEGVMYTVTKQGDNMKFEFNDALGYCDRAVIILAILGNILEFTKGSAGDIELAKATVKEMVDMAAFATEAMKQ